MASDDRLRPFQIDVPQPVIDDLRQRLQRTRWPEPAPVPGWQQGVPLAWLQAICQHWASGYDWPQRQALLNRHPQFITQLDGLDIHFLHLRSPHAGAMPLLLTHGWPGSVVEFQKVIGPLTDPSAHGGNAADAFHLVIPSLPGFGFSAKPATTGWGVDRIASAWALLMARLGYQRYAAQGGDWGSAVTSALGAQDAAHCLGIHVTLAMGARPLPTDTPAPDELHALQRARYYRDWDSAYAKQQATRPQTLGYALTDSPTGQAAWILEKFWAWTDCGDAISGAADLGDSGHQPRDPLQLLDRDALLDNLMLYWVTASAASSARLYWESFGAGKRQALPVTVPTGVAVYPQEIVPPVRRWMQAAGFQNICHWQAMPRGGHFAAFEQPALFVDDLRAFFRTLR